MAGTPAVVSPEIVFRRVAAAAAIGMIVIGASSRGPSPLILAELSLAVMVGLAMLLARMHEATWQRAALIVLLAALAAPLGYFFGPGSSYAAIVALLLAVTGMLTARQSTIRARTGWIVLAVICLGQMLIVILAAYGVIADISLAPVKRVELPWRNVSVHFTVQGVYICAFLAGRATQKRYRRIVLEALDATRTVAIREALLDEARADYARALELQARAEAVTVEPQASASLRTVPEATAESTTHEVTQKPRRAVTVLDDTRAPWSDALITKLRLQDLYVLAACLAGVYFTATVVHAPTPRLVSLVAIIGIVVMVALRALLVYSRPTTFVAWPYPVIAVLSAGPAYGFGLHTAFSAIVATVLFASRLFRTAAHVKNRGILSLYGVCASHAVMFTLVYAGVLPDTSNLPVRLPGATDFAPILHHLMVQAVYIVAYLAGGRIDREFLRATTIAREAYADAARADAKLRVAHSELDAALQSQGLFTGTAVGNYQLGRLLGRGGMGEVYEANTAGKRVALKLLRADRLGDPHAVERFQQEAQVLVRVASPHCARVIEVGGDSAVPYLAMEYVDGPSLSKVLRERGRLELPEVVSLVEDLSRGLGDVHAAGIVHLDLKPSNVLRGGERWMIVDFGIARMLTAEAQRRVAGTPPYMAPEQALGEPLDTRTDLYSLSLILYRAITGRPAYVGSDAAVIAQRARRLGPPDPREVVTIDDDLALVLRIGCAAAIEDRFATTAELQAAFVGALTGRLDPAMRARGHALLARAPWSPQAPMRSSAPDISLRSTR